jgi:hypothetical protein
MRSARIAMLILCCSFSTFCGNPALIGNLRLDLLASANDSMITSGEMPRTVMEKKNPLVTGLYSLVIPGAGEFTTENYTKSAIFLSVEALLAAATIIYNNKSNNQFNVFENYANANWSIDRYAEWINNHGSDYQSGSGPGNGNIPIYPNPTLQQYATMISQINAWESANHSEGFSHELPNYDPTSWTNGESWYELIGKYVQFKYGWSSYPSNGVQVINGVPIAIPESDGGNYFNAPAPTNWLTQQVNYMKSRQLANDYYTYAQTMIKLLVVNHLVSAFDAFLSAKWYNKGISSSVGMRTINSGNVVTLVPSLDVKIGF